MPDTHFAVCRLNWRDGVRLPGESRLATFSTRADADADRARREANARAAVTPFDRTDAIPHLSTHSEADFRNLLAGMHLHPPEPDHHGFLRWKPWWEKLRETVTPADLTRLWDFFNRVTFYAVREKPVRPVGYVLAVISWGYNDEFNYCDPEGVVPQAVYRTREAAVAAYHANYPKVSRQIQQWIAEGNDPYEADGWLPCDADPLDKHATWPLPDRDFPLLDIIEVELEEGL